MTFSGRFTPTKSKKNDNTSWFSLSSSPPMNSPSCIRISAVCAISWFLITFFILYDNPPPKGALPFEWSPEADFVKVPPKLRCSERRTPHPRINCDDDDMDWRTDHIGWYATEFANSNAYDAAANGWNYDIEYVLSMTAPLNLTRGNTLLDVGCGNGFFAQQVWSQLDIAVVGVDPLRFYVQEAKRLLPDAVFCRGSATNLSFIPSSFADATISIFPFNHLSDLEALEATRELLRVTKKGGTILLGTMNRGPKGSFGEEQYGRLPIWWTDVAAKALGLNATSAFRFGEARRHARIVSRYHLYIAKE